MCVAKKMFEIQAENKTLTEKLERFERLNSVETQYEELKLKF